MFSAVIEGSEVTEAGTAQLDVSGDTLEFTIDNEVGEVTIEPGADGEITVDFVKCAYGISREQARNRLDDVTVDLRETSERAVNLTVDCPGDGFSLARVDSVDLTLTVPRTMDLIVRNGVGDIDARDLRAPDRLHVSGGVGNITLTNIDAGPDTVIKSDVGDVRFEGALADVGSAKITTDVGKVIVRLPENAGAELDACASVGSIAMRGLMASDRNLKKNIPARC